jgi:hypothetical protein
VTLARSFYSPETTAFDYLQARAPRELWAAVLKQAIEDARHGPSQSECMHLAFYEMEQFRRDVRAAAEDWIADDVNEPRRFLWVCDVLGLDPEYVRCQIKERICNA